jgi:hypothetical protein
MNKRNRLPATELSKLDKSKSKPVSLINESDLSPTSNPVYKKIRKESGLWKKFTGILTEELRSQLVTPLPLRIDYTYHNPVGIGYFQIIHPITKDRLQIVYSSETHKVHCKITQRSIKGLNAKEKKVIEETRHMVQNILTDRQISSFLINEKDQLPVLPHLIVQLLKRWEEQKYLAPLKYGLNKICNSYGKDGWTLTNGESFVREISVMNYYPADYKYAQLPRPTRELVPVLRFNLSNDALSSVPDEVNDFLEIRREMDPKTSKSRFVLYHIRKLVIEHDMEDNFQNLIIGEKLAESGSLRNLIKPIQRRRAQFAKSKLAGFTENGLIHTFNSIQSTLQPVIHGNSKVQSVIIRFSNDPKSEKEKVSLVLPQNRRVDLLPKNSLSEHITVSSYRESLSKTENWRIQFYGFKKYRDKKKIRASIKTLIVRQHLTSLYFPRKIEESLLRNGAKITDEDLKIKGF